MPEPHLLPQHAAFAALHPATEAKPATETFFKKSLLFMHSPEMYLLMNEKSSRYYTIYFRLWYLRQTASGQKKNGHALQDCIPRKSAMQERGKEKGIPERMPDSKEKKPAAPYSRTGESRTTLGEGALNFRVRNGNGCDNSSMATGKKPQAGC